MSEQFETGANSSDWRHRALCRNEDPELFFYDGKETTYQNNKQIKAAKAVCKQCPVKAKCLEWALDTDQKFGIWGGLSEVELETARNKERNKRSWQRRKLAQAARTSLEMAIS